MFVVCKLLLMDVFPHRFDSRQQFDIYFALFLGMIIFVNTGFRSRVKYFSIVDPTQTTYYISEILDAGLQAQGPLFMVSFSFSVPSAHLFFSMFISVS